MLEDLLISRGEPVVLAGAGALTGLVFGWAAQRSRFCLRAATVEVAEGQFGPRLAIWLIAFFAAMALTQAGIAAGVFDVSSARQLAAEGSVSGALIGGLMFGVGMILARGCASRLLVLSATGNLRALITGLVVTLVAQASYTGILAPAREALTALWTVPGGAGRSLLDSLGLTNTHAALLATVALAASLGFGLRRRLGPGTVIGAMVVGGAVAMGWALTAMIAATSFEIVPVSSVTFTGPATDTLMALVTQRSVVLSFGIGLVPGVFVGAAAAALLFRDWKLERFGADTPMEKYLAGAVLMGFGAMLAGGCAVGAGVSGGAVFSTTALLAVFAMWIGAMTTVRVMAAMARGGAQTV
ncbi:YeeE/YedE family protein [Roseicyclus persicicus]|uniref:YeeE/YedE family protein n=1 Tax=Roseicyclus persicicus TaxID=2650661 RepID=A0A7X6JYE5_9RHOB|nr:YeeE/YedE family protein [Roseibacterium persicicum]NKX45735.1 YeeE/YedE family protein [Roseibacterium persicicum]